MQDLAEVIGDLKAASVGLSLKLLMRIELSGDPHPSDSTVAKINEVLSKVSKTLVLR